MIISVSVIEVNEICNDYCTIENHRSTVMEVRNIQQIQSHEQGKPRERGMSVELKTKN